MTLEMSITLRVIWRMFYKISFSRFSLAGAQTWSGLKMIHGFFRKQVTDPAPKVKMAPFLKRSKISEGSPCQRKPFDHHTPYIAF